jgi:co-chaperonin GroES (HSP10)
MDQAQIDALVARFGPKVRPLRDNVAWFRIEYKHPTLDVPGLRTNRGIVIAVGPGRRQRRKVKVPVAAGQFHEAEIGPETGRVIPTTVKPGDVLEFSPNGQTEFTVDGVTLVMAGEKSVLGYADIGDTQGLMFPSPNGFQAEDRVRKVVGRF